MGEIVDIRLCCLVLYYLMVEVLNVEHCGLLPHCPHNSAGLELEHDE